MKPVKAVLQENPLDTAWGRLERFTSLETLDRARSGTSSLAFWPTSSWPSSTVWLAIEEKVRHETS